MEIVSEPDMRYVDLPYPLQRHSLEFVYIDLQRKPLIMFALFKPSFDLSAPAMGIWNRLVTIYMPSALSTQYLVGVVALRC
jgi:hypothetical protein